MGNPADRNRLDRRILGVIFAGIFAFPMLAHAVARLLA
jgi:hypothetical protein